MLQELQIPHSKAYLKDLILSHPDNNSLLSIVDTFSTYGVTCMPVKIGKEKLDQVPLPTIVQTSIEGSTYFNIIEDVNEEHVILYTEKNKKKRYSREDFIRLWTGVTLLVEKTEDSTEPEIQKSKQKQNVKIALLALLGVSLLAWTFDGFSTILSTNEPPQVVASIGYFLLKVCGMAVASLLLWYEIESDNPTLKEFCSAGVRTDCGAVLGSKYSSILGGNISLSLLVFAYYSSGVLVLLGTTFSSVGMLSILSLMVLPIAAYSLYLQAFVIKNWCRLCILVQGILILEAAVVWFGNFYATPINPWEVAQYSFLFIGMVLGWMILKPRLLLEKSFYTDKRALAKFKGNPDVFGNLLMKSRKITHDTQGLGIQFKNEFAKYHVVKVCNPYCGPCSRAHPILERLYHEGSINLQILFSPDRNIEEPKTKTIGHILAIDNEGKPELTRQALDDWYGANTWDYEAFAKKYPLQDGIANQIGRIDAMRVWCERERITHTPTIFINGYELPKDYNFNDLTYILN